MLPTWPRWITIFELGKRGRFDAEQMKSTIRRQNALKCIKHTHKSVLTQNAPAANGADSDQRRPAVMAHAFDVTGISEQAVFDLSNTRAIVRRLPSLYHWHRRSGLETR